MSTTEKMLSEIGELKTANEKLSNLISLKNIEVDSLKSQVISYAVPLPTHAPFATRAEARACIDGFRNAEDIEIPLSIMFDSRNLRYLSRNPNIYPFVRFYFGTKKDSNQLTLVAVAVTANNEDEDSEMLLDNTTTTQMYEFADPCPKCNINGHDQATGLLYDVSDPAFYQFYK